ncbi:MAG: PorV/PorQ family protein [Elusimicrobia bacterium]|nr:PorV/PorQ family protein [Elusimicrobiota bacterium]
MKDDYAKVTSHEAVGKTTADFLNLPIGARAASMGGAYSAISEEASAIYWNPAGLVQISKLSALFMRSTYLEDISYQYASYAQRLSYDSVMAASIFMSNIGSIDHLDTSRNKLGAFSPRDTVVTLAYSKAVLEFSDKEKDVSIGVAVKHINSKIIESANTVASDIGIMTYNFTSIPYRLGVMISNVGNGLKFDKERNSLPQNVKLSGAVNPFKNMLISADVVFPKHNKTNFLVGAELSTEPNELTRLSFRTGLNSQKMRDDLTGFTMGIGITLHFFTLDYAYVPMGDLGKTHQISLTFDFPFRSPVFQRRDRSIFTKIKGISFK